VRRSGQSGFGVVETLMTMLLVGVVLGIVGRGYQTLSRLNMASYQMSQRMELTTFLQLLSYEVSCAITVQPGMDSLSFQRLDPTLNLGYYQPAPTRLPWPIPSGATAGDLIGPYLETVEYQLNGSEKQMERTAFGETSVVAVNVGAFEASLGSQGRILTLTIRPGEMTAPVKTQVLLPVVRP
jgi:type II secretory pathway pseudopilin PulG